MTYTAGVQDGTNATTLTSYTSNGALLRLLGVTSSPASTAWPANNDAYAIPFRLSVPVAFVGCFFMAGTSPGTTTYDLGIYRDDFTLITSLGSTAAVNTTSAVLPVGAGTFTTPVTLARGRYFMAMSSAATTLTAAAIAPTNQILRALGMFKMATAHPLPSTFVPASMGATTFMPLMGLTTTANAVL